MTMRFGAAFWVERTDWPGLRDAVLHAEAVGFDDVWIDDHLLCDEGDPADDKFEAWTTLAAVAAVTTRVRLGHMVGANTLRNPGLVAKMATTLDHVSGGRMILGLGSGWFEREHEAFGIDFGAGFGERLDRLDEAVMLVRRLLDGETVTHPGPVYPMTDAVVAPRPVQARLPIMIGGSGRTKTLRTLARYGDQWNTSGSLEHFRERDAILRAHCEAVGRDEGEIERTATVDLIIRDSRAAAMTAYRERLAATGDELDEDYTYYAGTPAEIAEQVAPLLELGFRHLLVDVPAPYDLETIDRIGEVLELVSE